MHRRMLPCDSRATTRSRPLAALAFVACLASLLCAPCGAPLNAQTLAPKRTLTTGAAPGCGIVTTAPAARRDNAEARRLATAGQEAALIGDQAAARDAFARAATLNPGDELIAYDLGRAHEELADSTKAISEFCRYLTLSPGGREAADVRDRLTRLVPRAAQQRAQDVQVAFKLGLALFDDGRYDASARAFDDVVKNAPTSAEGYFNRGLARAANGQRSDALADLEQYRANAPSVDDRVEVGRAIETLRRPVFSPSVALTRSIIPGFGQFYEAHPLRGVLVLVGAVGSAGFAFTSKNESKTINYVDPNGVPAPYTQSSTSKPYFAPAIAAAGAITIIGMIEAVRYAKKTEQGASIVPRRGTSTSVSGFSLQPTIDARGRAGFTLSASF